MTREKTMATIIDRNKFEAGKEDYTRSRMPLGAIYGQPGKLFYSPIKLDEAPERNVYLGIIDEFDMLVVEDEEYGETRKAVAEKTLAETFGDRELSELDEEQLDRWVNDTIDQVTFWLTPAYVTQSLKGVNLLVDLLYDLHDGVARNYEDFLERHGVVTRQWLNKIAIDLPEGTQRIWWEGGEDRFPNQATTTEYQLPDGTIIHVRWGNGTFELRGGQYSGDKKQEIAEPKPRRQRTVRTDRAPRGV